MGVQCLRRCASLTGTAKDVSFAGECVCVCVCKCEMGEKKNEELFGSCVQEKIVCVWGPTVCVKVYNWNSELTGKTTRKRRELLDCRWFVWLWR